MSAFDHAVESSEALADVRAIGAILAAEIAIGIAIVGWSVSGAAGWALGVAGLPGTTWLAWRMAPRAIGGGTRNVLFVSVELAFLAIAVADALVTMLLVGGAAIVAIVSGDGPVDAVGVLVGIVQVASGLVGVFAIGATFYGALALVVVLPAAVIWAFAVRLVCGRPCG